MVCQREAHRLTLVNHRQMHSTRLEHVRPLLPMVSRLGADRNPQDVRILRVVS
jgi:hypothetical protein